MDEQSPAFLGGYSKGIMYVNCPYSICIICVRYLPGDNVRGCWWHRPLIDRACDDICIAHGQRIGSAMASHSDSSVNMSLQVECLRIAFRRFESDEMTNRVVQHCAIVYIGSFLRECAHPANYTVKSTIHQTCSLSHCFNEQLFTICLLPITHEHSVILFRKHIACSSHSIIGIKFLQFA